MHAMSENQGMLAAGQGEERRERAMKALRETDQANQALLALKQQQKEQERLDDARIAGSLPPLRTPETSTSISER